MGFVEFLRKNVAPSLVGGGGALIAVWGFLGDAQSLWTAGVKPGYLQLTGFVLFVVATVSVVYRQHQHLEAKLARFAAPDTQSIRMAPAAVGAPAPALPAPEEPARNAAPPEPRPADRVYAPERFVAQLAKFLDEEHTDLQLSALLSPHLGEWIRAEGALRTLTDHGDSITVHVLLAPRGRTIYVNFGIEWRAQLAHIKPGDRMRFDAEVTTDFRGHARLANASLI